MVNISFLDARAFADWAKVNGRNAIVPRRSVERAGLPEWLFMATCWFMDISYLS